MPKVPAVFNTDLYGLLEVSPKARLEVIDAAYKKLRKICDAEESEENRAAADDLDRAYNILSDSSQRTAFDEHRRGAAGVVVGNFRVLEQIAEGSIGITYKGEHAVLKESVCIKVCKRISSAAEEIMIQEARAIWDVRHYAFPAMRDLIRMDEGNIVLVMSYIPGPTLARYVEKCGPFRGPDVEHVCWMAERLMNGLSFLHNMHGSVHGDVKPSNIILQNHSAVLVDFGLAMKHPTYKSESKGFTAHFAPPEAVARMPLLPESDLYSLGKTMLYALTGDLGLVDKNRIPVDTPQPLKDFIARMVSQEPKYRPRWREKESDEDPLDAIAQVRIQSFGRRRSNLKPFPATL